MLWVKHGHVWTTATVTWVQWGLSLGSQENIPFYSSLFYMANPIQLTFHARKLLWVSLSQKFSQKPHIGGGFFKVRKQKYKTLQFIIFNMTQNAHKQAFLPFLRQENGLLCGAGDVAQSYSLPSMQNALDSIPSTERNLKRKKRKKTATPDDKHTKHGILFLPLL